MLIQKHLNIISFLTAAVLMTTLTLVRKYVYLQGPLIKGTPEIGGLYIVSTVCIIFSLVLIYLPLRNFQHKSVPVFSVNNSKQHAYFFASIILSISLSLLLVINPDYFNSISYEDKLIEWVSFIFLAIGVCFFIACIRNTATFVRSNPVQITLIFFLVLYALIALEEVSWFTRALNVETPELFYANHQNEINLHNFFTDYSENLYYVGSHLYFVAIPVVAYCLGVQNETSLLRIFLAKPHLILIAMIASAYNYNMWNSLFVQLTFFSSVIALSLLYLKNNPDRERLYILLFIGFLLLTQTLYLCSGERYQRLHEITEFKEMFIALTLFIYAMDIHTEIQSIDHKNKVEGQAISH